MTKSVRFEVEYAVRTGPRLTDYRVLRPGEVIELTEGLCRFNTVGGKSVWDYTPEQQEREFGRTLCRVGDFAEPTTDDPRAARWYRPLSDTGFADVDGRIPVTSTTLRSRYVGPNDRRQT